MQSKATTVVQYLQELPADRKVVMTKLRRVIKKNLPKGYQEAIAYGMIVYCVPKSIYPAGYHADPTKGLMLMAIASQKNFIALYHMGIYADRQLLEWFTKAYKKQVTTKLDLGKSCIRFKHIDHIPYDLIGELATKMTVQDWIRSYERALQR